MTQILKRHPPALSIKVGRLAKQRIANEGLHAEQIKIIPGAAGGPKGLGLQGLDQAIFGAFLPRAPQKRTLIGASIGSWRFASIAAWGAKEGTERLAELYTHLHFDKKMTKTEVTRICANMLQALIHGKEDKLIHHPDYHLTILAVKALRTFQSDQSLALLASLMGIVAANSLGRKHTRHFMQRVICQPQHEQPFNIPQNDFTTHYETLTSENIFSWLMASASIPVAMSAIQNIPHTPGTYRDGGLIDYHIDLPFPGSGLVLYPHFTDHIVPGWFDKFFKSRVSNPEYQSRTILISPSRQYLQSLPLGRLPDRKDFDLKRMDSTQRIKMWKQCIAESHRMGDEFLELIEKQNFIDVLQPL